jgi:hypothetical protein
MSRFGTTVGKVNRPRSSHNCGADSVSDVGPPTGGCRLPPARAGISDRGHLIAGAKTKFPIDTPPPIRHTNGMTNMTAAPIDRLRRMAETGNLRATALEAIEELSDVREWAYALTDLADALESAAETIQRWVDAEEKDERHDAREEAIADLVEVVDAWKAAYALAWIKGLG